MVSPFSLVMRPLKNQVCALYFYLLVSPLVKAAVKNQANEFSYSYYFFFFPHYVHLRSSWFRAWEEQKHRMSHSIFPSTTSRRLSLSPESHPSSHLMSGYFSEIFDVLLFVVGPFKIKGGLRANESNRISFSRFSLSLVGAR